MSRRAALLLLASSLLLLRGADAAEPKPIKVLIITGQNNHKWRLTTPVLKKTLEKTERFRVDVTESPQTYPPGDLVRYDVYLLNYNGERWGEAFDKAFLENINQGKGVVVVHAANNPFADWHEYNLVIGRGWRRGAGHGAFHAFKVDITNKKHPITRGMPSSFEHAADELYHRLTGPDKVQEKITFLAKARSAKEKGGTGKKEPMAWVLRYGEGRVFHTPMGHAASSMESLGFQTFLRRGTEWATTGEVTLPVPEKLTAVD